MSHFVPMRALNLDVFAIKNTLSNTLTRCGSELVWFTKTVSLSPKSTLDDMYVD